MNLARYLLVALFGLPISFTDIRTRRIPNRLLLLMGVGGLLSYLLAPEQIVAALICTLIFASLLFPISLLRGAGLGAGDIKLIVVLALIVGRGAHILAALILASLLGLIQIFVTALVQRKFPRGIPFAPALIAGALLAIQ